MPYITSLSQKYIVSGTFTTTRDTTVQDLTRGTGADWLRPVADWLDNAGHWAAQIALSLNDTLKTHSTWALAAALLVFFGPWPLLLPLLLLQAALFAVLYVLGLVLNALIGGSPTALYEVLCHGPHTPAGSILALCEAAGAAYNRATGRSVPLACIRLAAAVLAVYIVVGVAVWW